MNRKFYLFFGICYLLLTALIGCKQNPEVPPPPANTATATATITSTPTFTGTPVLSATPTFTATNTHTITDTPTITPTWTLTATPTPGNPPASTCSLGSTTYGSIESGAAGSISRMSRFNNTSTITVSAISYFVYVVTGEFTTGTQNVAIYDDNAGQPNNLLASSGYQAASGIGWNTVSITPTVLAPGYYWLGVRINFDGVNYNISKDTTDALSGWISTSTAWPNPHDLSGSSYGTGFTIRAICQ